MITKVNQWEYCNVKIPFNIEKNQEEPNPMQSYKIVVTA